MKVQKETSLSRTICLLAQEIQNVMDRMLKPFNVTMEQLWILMSLSENNVALSQNDICQKSSKSPANITRIIDRLEKKSFVIRQASLNDRRACIVALTGRGRSLLQGTDVILKYFSSQFSSGINPESWDTTKQTLDTMIANLAGMSKELQAKGQVFHEDQGDNT